MSVMRGQRRGMSDGVRDEVCGVLDVSCGVWLEGLGGIKGVGV